MAPYSEYKRINENDDYDYNYNDNQSFRQLRPQQRRKPWRSGNIPNYNRQRPGHGPGQFDLKSALADIVSRMWNVKLTHFEWSLFRNDIILRTMNSCVKIIIWTYIHTHTHTHTHTLCGLLVKHSHDLSWNLSCIYIADSQADIR